MDEPGGRVVARDIAAAIANILGRTAAILVAIVPGQEVVAVGVEALENLGLRVDPTAKPPRLEPSRPFTLLAM